MIQIYKPQKDKSLSYLHGEGAASSIDSAGISYQSASLLSAGATAGQVALLSTITNLVFAVLLVKMPALIKFSDSLKRVVVALSIISVLGWLPLILVPIFLTGVSPSMLIILWVMSLVPDFLVGPLRDKWLADLVPSGRLGRYLGLRTVISTATYVGCFFVMGYMLDHWQTGVFNGFTVVFILSFLGSLLSVILYILIKVPVPVGEPEPVELGLFGFVREARQNELGAFIIFVTLVMFSASICSTFFSVYMLEDLHFTYLTFTLVISAEFVARIIGSQLWGNLIDTRGAIKVLRVISFLIPVIPVLWLFSANPGYLIGVQVLSGIAWSAFDLCSQAYLSRASPPEKRLHYIVYHRSIVTLASAAGPLLGAGLLNLIYPISGSQILSIFLLSGILRLLVIAALIPLLKGTDIESSEAGISETVSQREMRPGRTEFQPYHRTIYPPPVRVTWRILEFSTDEPGKRHSVPAVTAEKPKTGLLYHPELWSQPYLNHKPVRVKRLKDSPFQDAEDYKKWTASLTTSGV